MPKYMFSKGKITVEEGVYDPVIEQKKNLSQSRVLLTPRSKRSSGHIDLEKDFVEDNHVN